MRQRTPCGALGFVLLLFMIICAASCGGEDPVNADDNSAPPPNPPPLPVDYSGSFLVTEGGLPDGCGEGITLPFMLDVTVVERRFLLEGIIDGQERVIANGSFDPNTLRCSGQGFSWVEIRPGRWPATGCRTSFSFGAQLVFKDEDHFSGTVWLQRWIESEEVCFQTPCKATWGVTGTRIGTASAGDRNGTD